MLTKIKYSDNINLQTKHLQNLINDEKVDRGEKVRGSFKQEDWR